MKRAVSLAKWRKANPDHVKRLQRRERYLSKYGMSVEDAERMLEKQGGCAICKREVILGGKAGAKVDHCHKTNMTRGILCSSCNTGLGHFRDDPSLLATAILYVLSAGKAEAEIGIS